MITPEARAQQTLDAHAIRPEWQRTGEQVAELIAEAVRIDREELAGEARAGIPSGPAFYDALDAGTLNPAAKLIADAITRAGDNLDRWGSIYENAYRGAVGGLWYATQTSVHGNQLAAALNAFAQVAAELDGAATHLTCTEVASIRAVLTLSGHAEAAERLLEAHAWGDEDPDDCQHARYHELNWSGGSVAASKVGCCAPEVQG